MMKTKNVFMVVMLTVFVLSVPSFAEVGVTDSTIKVAMVCDLTGPVAVFGIQGSSGARAYFNYLNEKGGIHGRKIEFLTESDNWKPPQALAAAKKLIERDKVFCFVSNLGTPGNVAMLPLFEEKGVPNIGPMAGSTKLFNPPTKSTFVVYAPRFTYGQAEVDFIVNKLKMPKAKIAYFYQDDEIGQDSLRGLETQIKHHNSKGNPIKLVDKEPFKVRAVDFTANVLKAMNSKPDIVVIASYTPNTVRILKLIKRENWHPTLVIDPASFDPKLLDLAGDAVEGAIAHAVTPSLGADLPGVILHRKTMKKYFPKMKPTVNSLQGMLGAVLFHLAAEKAGKNLTRERIINVLDSGEKFDTKFMPVYTYSSKKRSGTNKTMFYKVESGKFVQQTGWLSPE